MSGEKDLVGQQGVDATRALFSGALGWYAREPTSPDYGIDMYAEAANDGVPNGRLVGIQVKSGASWFSEETDEGIVYRGGDRNVEYWLNHSLPVIVVLYDPEEKTAYWQAVTPETVASTGKGWKLIVPRAQVLDASAADTLNELAEGDPYLLALNQLRADRSWMDTLRSGGEVFVEVAEWVNKTSGRGQFALIGVSKEGDKVTRVRDVFWGLLPYEEVLPLLFPWATLAVDEELYDQKEEDAWDTETGAWDPETGRYITHSDSFTEWRESTGRLGIRPYEIEADELAHWRLALELNEVGRAFIALDDYLANFAEGQGTRAADETEGPT
jgi:uncharacterized protein DUF4365